MAAVGYPAYPGQHGGGTLVRAGHGSSQQGVDSSGESMV